MRRKFGDAFWFVFGPGLIGMLIGSLGAIFLFSFVFACQKVAHAREVDVIRNNALETHDSLFGTSYAKGVR